MSFTGGAPAVVGRVMTLLSSEAATASSEAKSATERAINAASRAPQLAPPDSVTPPEPPAEPDIDFKAYDPSTGFSELEDQVVRRIAEEFREFVEEFFPTDLSSAGNSWLMKVLTVGGTGINASVENQLWSRERGRITREAQRLADEAATTWMARGYSLPPGALLHQTAVIDSEAQEKIAESSRERAIKSFETEVENLRFAVGKIVDMRANALSTAVAYIGANIGAVQAAGQIAGNTADFYSKLSSTLVSLYSAQAEAEMNVARIASANAGLNQQNYTAQLQANTAYVGHQVNATMAAAQMLGTRAAAALNGLHAQASVSGSDVWTVSSQQ
jgi:hypothetical protein